MLNSVSSLLLVYLPNQYLCQASLSTVFILSLRSSYLMLFYFFVDLVHFWYFFLKLGSYLSPSDSFRIELPNFCPLGKLSCSHLMYLTPSKVLLYTPGKSILDGSISASLTSSASLGPGSLIGWSLKDTFSLMSMLLFVSYHIVMCYIYSGNHQIKVCMGSNI